MNYYIFDVKRQRGENIVHSDAEYNKALIKPKQSSAKSSPYIKKEP